MSSYQNIESIQTSEDIYVDERGFEKEYKLEKSKVEEDRKREKKYQEFYMINHN